MAKINIVTPSFDSRQFSGGILCLLEYAHGLTVLGHQVNVVPVLPSRPPLWFPKTYGTLVSPRLRQRLANLPSRLAALAWAIIARRPVQEVVPLLEGTWDHLALVFPHYFGPEIRQGSSLIYLREYMPEADVSIASSAPTALPVALYGKGKKFYFCQHYEPLFKNESTNPMVAEVEALRSYHLGLNLIANSSWLAGKLRSVGGGEVRVCANAIDHNIYNGQPGRTYREREFIFISYGGRNACWKGFETMARAMALARQMLPSWNLRWRVYGDALLSPDNPIACYESLGFLQPRDLAQAYRDAHALLSASWYESFPLFPIEAMACGLPVITSQPGTEEYAVAGETAAVIDPHSPQDIADAMVRLVLEPEYASKLAHAGWQKSNEFTWERSATRMERILLG